MRNILLLLILTTLSCTNQPKKTENKPIKNTTENVVKKQETENSKYYTKKDTILIGTETGDTLKYAKEDFNNIVDKHPELFKEYPSNPDQLYFNNNDRDEFDSEVGQDSYYVLYAYFLKQRNGINKYAQQRKKLIDIYTNINSLFEYFQYGGTYFGHQKVRISGYAEYSIYLLPKEKNDVEKTYDITKQKKLYISSLRQLIEDESKIDFNTLGKEKLRRNKQLNEVVDKLELLITDNFYLRRAQEFHYGHYEYY